MSQLYRIFGYRITYNNEVLEDARLDDEMSRRTPIKDIEVYRNAMRAPFAELLKINVDDITIDLIYTRYDKYNGGE